MKYLSNMNRDIGMAKLKSSLEYLQKIAETPGVKNEEIIVFVLHNIIKDKIVKMLKEKELNIRVAKFNKLDPKLDLKPVKICIFWELSYSPFNHILVEKLLLQSNPVEKKIYYLVGDDSKVDNWMLDKLQQKQWTHSLYFHNDKDWKDHDKHSAFSFLNHEIPSNIQQLLTQNEAYESTAFTNDNMAVEEDKNASEIYDPDLSDSLVRSDSQPSVEGMFFFNN